MTFSQPIGDVDLDPDAGAVAFWGIRGGGLVSWGLALKEIAYMHLFVGYWM